MAATTVLGSWVAAFSLTFRDSLEAFLVVGVVLAFLHRTRSERLVWAVYWGIAASVPVSVLGAWQFSRAADQVWWSGLLASTAAACAALLVGPVWHTRRHVAATGTAPPWRGGLRALGLLVVTIVMIAREGVELAPLLGTAVVQVGAPELIAGMLTGIAAAAALSWSWSRYGRRIEMPTLAIVSTIFLAVLVVQLASHGAHDLSARLDPSGLHVTLQPFGPEGVYGRALRDALLAAPLLWLLGALFWGHGKASGGGVAQVGR